ncbi:MAG: DUF2029 domain-containing protein [Phycisphaerae bacterium]|nr:DUF2029 domain-containing protein [Phycisphaerae bacterium]
MPHIEPARTDSADASAKEPTDRAACYHQTLLGQLDQRFLSSRAVRVALVALLGAILIVPSVQFVHRIEKIDKSLYRETGERHCTALGRWLPTAAVLADPEGHEDPYGYGHWFPTPPFVLICLVPFSMMGYTAAGIVWAALKVIGFVVAAALLIRELGRGESAQEPPALAGWCARAKCSAKAPHGWMHLWHRRLGGGFTGETPVPQSRASVNCSTPQPRPGAPGPLAALLTPARQPWTTAFAVPTGVILMTGIFSLRPVVSDIQHGNLNIFMMIWLALAWLLYMRKNDVSAGLFVGLAIVTKLTPALLLVYFIYKRAWRVCLGAAVGLFLFFIFLPGLYLGFGHNIELLHAWFDMLVAPFALHGYATLEIPNQSLYGVALRLLSNAGVLSIEHMPTDQAMSAGMESMARPLTVAGRLIRPATSLVVVGILAWLCRSKCPSRRDPRLLLEFGLILLAMLLLSERTWKHHGTTLPIVYLGVWYVLTCYAWSKRFTAWFVAGLVVQIILLLGTSEGILGERLAESLLDGGVFCWGLVLCLVQTGILLRALGALGAPSFALAKGGESLSR